MPPTFAETDELYHGLSMQPNIHLLATAYDDPSNCRTGASIAAQEKTSHDLDSALRKGRVFQTALGHDVMAMDSPASA